MDVESDLHVTIVIHNQKQSTIILKLLEFLQYGRPFLIEHNLGLVLNTKLCFNMICSKFEPLTTQIVGFFDGHWHSATLLMQKFANLDAAFLIGKTRNGRFK